MSRSPNRKTASSSPVVGGKLPRTPVWLVCTCFFALSLVGFLEAIFLLLLFLSVLDSATIRLLVWCAVETVSCIASGILFSKSKTRVRWFSVCVYVLSGISLVRIVVPLILMYSGLMKTYE